MASSRPYITREKAISAADTGTIRERWEYGRQLLVDDARTTPAGNLRRNGVLDGLVRAALKIRATRSSTSRYEGMKREIQYRLQVARAYPTEGQIRHVVSDFESWHDLIAAGFPPYPAAEGERPYDPRTTREIERAHDRSGASILPEALEQRALFERFGDDTTLAALQRYADEQSELTARFAARCEDRHAYLDALVKAVNGDLSRTYGEARAALAGPDGPPDP